MTIVLVIIGAIIGASTFSFFGFVAGSVLGYLLGTIVNLREQLIALKGDVKLLMANYAELQAGNKKPAEIKYARASSPAPGATSAQPAAFIRAPLEEQQISTADAEAERIAELERQAMAAVPVEPVTPRLPELNQLPTL